MIFVYGSLMAKGHANHLLNVCKYIARGHVRGYTLQDWGAFPVAMPCIHRDAIIWGELYKVPESSRDEFFTRLDGYEGTLYRRVQEIITADYTTDKFIHAYMYVCDREPTDMLGLSEW